MSILAPEIASLFGGIDSNAFAKGGSVNAYLLRTLLMNRNRLVAKGQHLCCLLWPTHDTTEVAGDVFSGFGPLRYTRVLPRVPVRVKPGLSTANVRMTMRSRAADIVHVQIATRGRPMTPSRVDARVTSATFTDVDIDGIALTPDRNGFEEFEIWIRGARTGVLGSTAANGTGNTGTFETVHAGELIDSGALWNRTGSGNPNWAEGYIVAFEDSVGNEVASPREIVAVTGDAGAAGIGNRLAIAPMLSPAEIQAIEGAGSYYSIYELPRWGIANFAAAAVARTS